MITAARQKAEEFTRRSFITQTWEMSLDQASGIVYLLRPPIQSVDEITLDGETVNPTMYHVDLASGRVHFFRTLIASGIGGLIIRYVSGYGEPENVPGPIKEAVLQIVGHLYENRESQDMPLLAQQLLTPYKVWLL